MAGEDEREPEAGKGEMPIPGRRACGRKLQRRSSPRQCCLEDKAQGAYSTQERTAPVPVLRTEGERDTDAGILGT